jgi:hypothetical protein
MSFNRWRTRPDANAARVRDAKRLVRRRAISLFEDNFAISTAISRSNDKRTASGLNGYNVVCATAVGHRDGRVITCHRDVVGKLAVS